MKMKKWQLVMTLLVWTCGGGHSVLGACDGDNPEGCGECEDCVNGGCVPVSAEECCSEQGGTWVDGKCCFECGTSCGFGGGSGGTESLKFLFSLGKDRWDRTAGRIFIDEETLSPRVFTPAILKTKKLGRDAQLIKEGGVLRQLLVNQGLVDIVTNGTSGFELRFYTIDQVVGLGGNGRYQLVNGAVTSVVWRVENPNADTNDFHDVQVSRVLPSGTNTFVFHWDATNDVWSYEPGNGLLIETLAKTDLVAGETRLETRELKDPDQTVRSKTETTVRKYGWGEQHIREVIDPDGAALETLSDYYDKYTFVEGLSWSPYPGFESRLSYRQYPDGRWTRFAYDTLGRRAIVQDTWLDVPNNASLVEAAATNYDYTTLDPHEVPSVRDWQPRTVTRTILGIVAEKTFHAYYTNATGDRIHIKEQAVRQDAGYGDSDNLRTTEIKYPKELSGFAADQLKQATHPDGRLDQYAYEEGDYVENGSSPGAFVPGSGSFVRKTITHGTIDHPEGIAFKSTREVIVVNRLDRDVLKETFVFVGSGQYELMDWTVNEYDELFNLTASHFANGTSKSSSWGPACCGKESDVDVDGTTTFYSYDALKRKTAQTKAGVPAGEYPAQPDVATTYAFDAAGKVRTETVLAGGLSLVTSNEYDLAGRLTKTVDPAGLVTTHDYQDGGRITTVTRPGGATEITENYLDGRVKSVTGTAVVSRYYDYGVHSDGSQWTLVRTGSTNSPMWEKTTTDMLGRTLRAEKPAFGGGVATNEFLYNAKGQFVRATTPGLADTLYEYDELGRQVRSGSDVNGNGALDLASVDRIQETDMQFTEFSNVWWRETRRKVYPVGGTGGCVTVAVQRTVFSGSGCACKAEEGVLTDIFGNDTVTTLSINRDTKTSVRTTLYSDSTNTEIQTQVNGLLRSSLFKTGLRYLYLYDALGRRTGMIDPRTGANAVHYNAKGQVDYVEDAGGNRTTYAYDDAAGRRISVTDPLTNTVYVAYNLSGQMTNTWGATYPVAYEFDLYGRMTAMKTWREENGSPDMTAWLYDETTGLMTNKLYADGQGPTYEYDAAGRLTRRTWARGITTDYSYDSLGQLTNIVYSDNTPDVSFTFDRLGRQVTITDALGTRTNVYDGTTLALVEEQQPDGTTLSRTYDAYGRPSGFGLDSDYAVTYSYDSIGRFASVSSSVASVSSVVQYSRVPDSDLIAGWSNGTGFAVTREFEAERNLITSVLNAQSGVLIRRFEYANDAVGRRTQRADMDPSDVITNLFDYNPRSELIGAVMGTNSFGYSYDPIGNRQWARINATTNDYIANELNQYLSVSSVTSVVNLSYDPDGNLTNDGERAYAWDAENRLIRVEWDTNVVENAYDYMSRRVEKTVNGASRQFAYDGWAIIRERASSETNSYLWGLDLSGTLQGAGGIGGLLAVVGPLSSDLWFPAYDANGNIADYVTTNGGVAAHYSYDPYGNVTIASGAKANDFAFRFSTKYADPEMGLLYYGFRFYSPTLGKWLSSDLASERGGLNLYGFVFNAPPRMYDPLGLAPQLCGIDENGMPIYCDDPDPCWGHCPPDDDSDPGAECLDAPGLPADSSECDEYGDRRYLGTSLKCFCKCAGDSDWSKKVRGCLRCMDKNGVDPWDAHMRCYDAASAAGYERPNITLGCCYILCLKGSGG